MSWTKAAATSVALSVAGMASAAMASPPTWVVQTETATVYMVGTIHLLPDDAQWWSKDFAAVFDSVESLHLELDLTAPQDIMGPMQRYAMSAEPLSEVLGAESAAALDAVLARHGQTIESYQAFQPWFAYMQLSSLMAVDAGLSATSGIDLALANAAMQQGLPVHGIESMEDQFGVFADLAPQMQVQILDETVAAYDMQVEMLNGQVDAWLTGEIGAVAIMNWATSVQYPELFAGLMSHRNAGFADAIQTLLEQGGTSMVAVGLGHFVGPEAIPRMLQERGYEVVRWEPGA